MTRQKSFKRRVRTRMTKTGERYAAARGTLIDRAERMNPPADLAEAPPPAGPAAARSAHESVAPADAITSDEAVVKATGRTYVQWFALLDASGAASGKRHPEIVRWLSAEYDVPSWWRQAITVSYERARGLRAPGQRSTGWSVSATRTVAVAVERLFAAFEDPALRERWLPGADLRLRTATAPRTARYDWADGPSRVEVSFAESGPMKSRVAVEHSRLADGPTTEQMRSWWRDRLAALKELLEAA